MRPRTLVAIGLTMTLLAGSALAAGSRRRKKKDPKKVAEAAFRSGKKQTGMGDSYMKRAKQSKDLRKRSQLQQQARNFFVNAAKQFEKAVKADAKDHQSWNELGYARRKSGDFEGAMEAYDEALALKPGYAPAVEYRGEASLALGRLEDAKSAYMELVRSDRKLAAELAAAMQKWIQKRRLNRKGIGEEEYEGFKAWFERREQLAGQAGGAEGANTGRW